MFQYTCNTPQEKGAVEKHSNRCTSFYEAMCFLHGLTNNYEPLHSLLYHHLGLWLFLWLTTSQAGILKPLGVAHICFYAHICYFYMEKQAPFWCLTAGSKMIFLVCLPWLLKTFMSLPRFLVDAAMLHNGRSHLQSGNPLAWPNACFCMAGIGAAAVLVVYFVISCSISHKLGPCI